MATITSATATKKSVEIVISGESDDTALRSLRDLLGSLSNESIIKLVGSQSYGRDAEKYFRENFTNIVDSLYQELDDVLD